MKQNAAIRKWKKVQQRKSGAYIEYVHIPKTGGTFVKSVLSHTKIIPVGSRRHMRGNEKKKYKFYSY